MFMNNLFLHVLSTGISVIFFQKIEVNVQKNRKSREQLKARRVPPPLYVCIISP